jgi:hypothetical protein
MSRDHHFSRPHYGLNPFARQPSDESLGYYQSSAKRGLGENAFYARAPNIESQRISKSRTCSFSALDIGIQPVLKYASDLQRKLLCAEISKLFSTSNRPPLTMKSRRLPFSL